MRLADFNHSSGTTSAWCSARSPLDRSSAAESLSLRVWSSFFAGQIWGSLRADFCLGIPPPRDSEKTLCLKTLGIRQAATQSPDQRNRGPARPESVNACYLHALPTASQPACTAGAEERLPRSSKTRKAKMCREHSIEAGSRHQEQQVGRETAMLRQLLRWGHGGHGRLELAGRGLAWLWVSYFGDRAPNTSQCEAYGAIIFR